jgi:hypothetical protein
MSDLFSFLNMIGTHEQRVVGNTKINSAVIDTCASPDSSDPYETGITHPNFNDNNWVIVEQYANKNDAAIGHKKWVDLFTGSLPDTLKDVSTCTLAEFGKQIGIDVNREYTNSALN